ncbi:MAG: protease complex subunit PrcB family protein [Clostridia bacterium]|jgi:hypothetical protein
MKRNLLAILFILVIVSGCSESFSGNKLLNDYYMTNSSNVSKIEIDFLTDAKAKIILNQDQENDLENIIHQINESRESKEPLGDSFSAPLHCSHLLRIYGKENTDTDLAPLKLYYSIDENRLIYTKRIQKEEKEIIEYRYLEPPAQFKRIMENQIPETGISDQENKITVSQEKLRASISKEDLNQPGENLEYNIYSGVFLYNGHEPLYQVFTKHENYEIPHDKVLIVVSGGKTPSGGYGIDIEAIESNDQYNKVYVSFTESEEGNSESKELSQPTVAVLCDKKDFSADKWIVFIGPDDEILYVQCMDE